MHPELALIPSSAEEAHRKELAPYWPDRLGPILGRRVKKSGPDERPSDFDEDPIALKLLSAWVSRRSLAERLKEAGLTWNEFALDYLFRDQFWKWLLRRTEELIRRGLIEIWLDLYERARKGDLEAAKIFIMRFDELDPRSEPVDIKLNRVFDQRNGPQDAQTP